MKKNTRRIGVVVTALMWSVGLAIAQSNRIPEEAPDTRLVQINLLTASKSGSSDLSDLPTNTRKAIDDIKDFLPFKSYSILDTSLIRVLVPTPDRGPGLGAKTFMTGPDGVKLQIWIAMTGEKGSHEVYVQRFELSPSAMDRFRPVPMTPEQQRQVDPSAPAIAPRADLLDLGALISTSFTANLGQTVVVGSSRLNGGDEALIVLFTALP